MTPAHGSLPSDPQTPPLHSPVRGLIGRLREHLSARVRATIVDHDSRPAAVLVPIVATSSGLRLLCFERSTTVLEHRGEICFPGGSVDAIDQGAIAAALRETHEELGIETSGIEVVGLLDDVRTAASRYVITPVVGFLASLPALIPSEAEVARTLFAPIEECKKREVSRFESSVSGGRWIYSYDIDGDVIWGATARIIHALIGALRAIEKESA